jgi:hypothetical protein
MRILLFFIIVSTLVSALPAAPQDSTGPLSRNQILDALKAGGLSADELSAIVRRRGLDFEMSGDLERSFREAGADTNFVRALWEKEKWDPPKGGPLTKDFLTALIQSGTPSLRLSKWIAARKINFELTPGAIGDLRTAGASDQVLVLVTTNNVWAPPPPPPKPTYEQPLALAREALRVGKYDVAESQANIAKLMDPTRPEAFAVIGYVYLYHFNSFSKADSEYRSAIEKGGEVEFRVRHVDHVNKLGKAETCVGRLLLKKDSLVFRSSLADHNLALTGKQIVEARVNSSVKTSPGKRGVQLFASQGGGKPTELIFHAARDKDERDEEKIIVDLINAIRQYR